MKNRKKWLTLKCFTCHDHKVQKHLVDPNCGQSNIKSIYIYIYIYIYKQCFIFQKNLSSFQQKNLRKY